MIFQHRFIFFGLKINKGNPEIKRLNQIYLFFKAFQLFMISFCTDCPFFGDSINNTYLGVDAFDFLDYARDRGSQRHVD